MDILEVVEIVDETKGAVIKVIGVGGGGCNAINNMITVKSLFGIDFISANTDAQSLNKNNAKIKIQLGGKLTNGLGAGAKPNIGYEAAMESREDISNAISGSNMLFITTGMGGGTGTGAAPAIAEIAKELGILTVAVVTKPFEYEGKRVQIALDGIAKLKEHVDSLIVIPNDKLLTKLGDDISMRDAFLAADNVLSQAVSGIYEVIKSSGIINLDFGDVKNIMSIKGVAMMGSAEATGPNRARVATEEAISNPLLDDVSLNGAKGVLLNITTHPNCLKMSEYKEIMTLIKEYVDTDAELKFGTVEDETMQEDQLRVTIIATDLKEKNQPNKLRIVKSKANDIEQEFNISAVTKPGRGYGNRIKLTSEDFKNQAVLDNMEIPAILRRQVD